MTLDEVRARLRERLELGEPIVLMSREEALMVVAGLDAAGRSPGPPVTQPVEVEHGPEPVTRSA